MSKADPSKDLPFLSKGTIRNPYRIPILQAICKIKIQTVIESAVPQNLFQLMARMLKRWLSRVRAIIVLMAARNPVLRKIGTGFSMIKVIPIQAILIQSVRC